MKTLMIFCCQALMLFMAAGCLVLDLATGSTYPQMRKAYLEQASRDLDDCILKASQAGLGTIKAKLPSQIPYFLRSADPYNIDELQVVYEMDPAQKEFMERCLRGKRIGNPGKF
jgi:hypothetical protein